MRKLKYIKHLKLYESFENDGFELSSHEERNRTREIFKSIKFTDDEWKEIVSVMISYQFKELNQATSFFTYGNREVYLSKYEDDWYYVLYYKDQNSNAIIYKCSEFEGLINCLNYIGKNYV